MGFNIFISSDRSDIDFFSDPCSDLSGIARSYYVLAANSSESGNDGVMLAAGEAVGVDLEPFTRYIYEGMPCFDDEGNEVPCADEQPPANHWLSIETALDIATRFRDAVMANPTLLRTLPAVESKNRAHPERYYDLSQCKIYYDYFESGRVVEDFNALIAAFECHKRTGATKVRFWAG